ncbi:MAG: hypothetical protein ACYSW2_19440 [Planctomycetota bacterium]|jgi:hypothetical protein
MKIVSFINPAQRDVIDRILTPCGVLNPGPAPARTVTPHAHLRPRPGRRPAEPVWAAQ